MTAQGILSSLRNMASPIALTIAISISFVFSGTNYGEVALLAVFVYIAAVMILYREEIPYSSIHIVLYLFLVYLAINPYWSINYYQSMFHILILCQIPLFLMLLSTEKIQKSWSIYLVFMAISALISSSWGIIQYIQIDQSNYLFRFRRVSGFLYDPNSFAGIQYIFSILLFSLSYKFTPTNTNIRYGVWVTQFLVIAALFVTLSRSGIMLWLLFIIVMYLYAYIHNINRLKIYVYLLLMIALIAFIFTQFLSAVIEQPLSREDLAEGIVSSSFNGRLEMWEPTLKLVAEKPILGWGLNSYQSLYPSIREEQYSAGSVVHNDYIQFALEGGGVLLLFILMFLGFHLYLIFKLFTRKSGNTDHDTRAELVAMLFANLALLIHSFTNFSFYILQLCILSGIIFARTCYLSVQTGLLKSPAVRMPTPNTRRLLVGLITLIMVPLLYRAASGFLFVDSERYSISRTLSSNTALVNFFTAISPLDHASSNKLVGHLYSRAKTNPDKEEKRRIVDYAISIIDPITKEYPYDAINYYNLGYLLKYAYTEFPDRNEKYDHYTDVWMRTTEVNPVYFPAYQKLYEDLASKQQYQKALALVERLVPWIKDGWLSRKDVLITHDMLINLAEKTGDELLPLYRKLSLSAQQKDNTAYYDTLKEINKRLKSRNAPIASHTDNPSLPGKAPK